MGLIDANTKKLTTKLTKRNSVQRRKAYREANKEKICVKAKAYRQANKTRRRSLHTKKLTAKPTRKTKAC